MEKKKMGRKKIYNRTLVTINIENEYLIKMREFNRSYFINQLLKKHFENESAIGKYEKKEA